jgi:hypothetical protein
MPKNGAPHTFVGEMPPRQPTHAHPKSGQACDECERKYRIGEGPACGHQFMFTLREGAFALIKTGEGFSNRSTAQGVRKVAIRPSQKPRLLQRQRGPGGKPQVPRRRTEQAWSNESNVVADYIDIFAPTVLAELRAEGELPSHWPRGLAIDSTSLRGKKLVKGQRRSGGEDAGEIYAAMGTNVAHGEAKPVALSFMGGKDHQSALDFFATMPGTPEWVVTDGDEGLAKAIGIAWPQAMHYICEEHLRKLGRKAYQLDRLGLLPNSEQLGNAVDKAQFTGRYLDDLIDMLEALPASVAPRLRAWVTEYEPLFRRQVAMRTAYPGMPRSIGSTEQLIDWVGKKVADRHGSWRNLSRVNLVFQLMLAHRAGAGDETRYMQIIRKHLEANGGATGLKTAADYKRFRDRAGDSSLVRFLKEINARTVVYRAIQQNSSRGPRARKVVARKSAELVAQGLPPVKLNNRNRRPGGPSATNYRNVNGRMVSDFPEGKQWHPTKNGDLRAEDVRAGSGLRVWWLCEVHPSHEWQQLVKSRTAGQQRCPFCTNRRLSVTNCLATIRPDLALEWDTERNEGLTPRDILAGSNSDGHWVCRICRHRWKARVNSRSVAAAGCPKAREHHEPDLFDLDWGPRAFPAPEAMVEDPDLPF